MPRDTKTYDIVLSCPTDVINEKAIIEEVIQNFNMTIGANLSINLNLKHWSKNSFAQTGASAQELLNRQFIDDADMIICIFWNRMGTPTDNYESGTAEELMKTVKSGKQAFLYFSNAPISPDDIDMDQRMRVKKFEEKIIEEKIGLHKYYQSLGDFKQMITQDLNLYFLRVNEDVRIQNKISELAVSGVRSSSPDNFIISNQLFPNFSNFKSKLNNEIKEMIYQANDINVEPRKSITEHSFLGSQAILNGGLFGSEEYILDQEVIEKIEIFCRTNDIVQNANFFELGNLKKQYSFNPTGRSWSPSGTNEETEKEKIISAIFNKISKLESWKQYVQQFSSLKAVHLCLSNRGKIFENDITVKIRIPKESYVALSNLNPPKQPIIDQIIESNFIEEIFGDITAVDIQSYNYQRIHYNNPTMPYLGYSKSYEDLVEEYNDQLAYINDFEEFYLEDFVILKYHFSEIKQYTHVSFPSVLLFKDEISALSYEIISRNNPEKIENKIINQETEN